MAAQLTEAGNILMRSLFEIHKILKSHEKLEPRVLAHHVVRGASALPQVLQRARQSPEDTDNENLKTVVTIVSRSITSLIAAFNKLNAPGADVQGHVIYALAKMYGKLVDFLGELAISEAKIMTDEECASSQRKQSPSKSQPKQPKSPKVKDNLILNMMTGLLCKIIDALDPKVDSHKALFEGCAYVTLNKLGSQMFLLVFGHRRGSTMEEELARSTPPDGIE